jgi:hypothetical protein
MLQKSIPEQEENRMKRMKRMIEHIMTYLAAAAYAEVGEFDTVRSLVLEDNVRKYETQKKHRTVRLTTSRPS